MDRLAVEALQAVAEHRAVRLGPNLLPDVGLLVEAPAPDAGAASATPRYLEPLVSGPGPTFTETPVLILGVMVIGFIAGLTCT